MTGPLSPQEFARRVVERSAALSERAEVDAAAMAGHRGGDEIASLLAEARRLLRDVSEAAAAVES